MVTLVLDAGTRPRVSSRRERLVTGRDLIEQFQLEPGPLIGTILDRVDEARGAGEIATRDEGLELAAQVLEESRRSPPGARRGRELEG